MQTGFKAVAGAAAALFCVATVAEEKRFGAWAVSVVEGEEVGVYAATMNDSNGVLGQFCYQSAERCVWLLANDINCEDGNRYPVLVNSDSGAVSTEIYCMKQNGKPRYAFADFDVIDDVVRRSQRVGIAFPMKNGLFQVSRFSLDGAAAAVGFMRKVSEAMVNRASGSTVDRTY